MVKKISVLMFAVVVLALAAPAWAGHGTCPHKTVLLNQSLMKIDGPCDHCASKGSKMSAEKVCPAHKGHMKDMGACPMKSSEKASKDGAVCPFAAHKEKMSAKSGCCMGAVADEDVSSKDCGAKDGALCKMKGIECKKCSESGDCCADQEKCDACCGK